MPVSRLAVALALFGAVSGAAQTLDFDFASAAQEARYRQLARELRCLVCQNQSLADSNAPLADDLRLELYEQVRAGRTEQQIKAFMTERYGDFILYKPRLSVSTAALWIMPLVLLLSGGFALARVCRAGPQPAPRPLARKPPDAGSARPDTSADGQ